MVDDPQTVVVDPGTGISQLSVASFLHLSDILDAVWLDINCEIGDDQQGAAVTYGEIASDRSADDYFNSDLILIWGGNPAYTQIPNFHFLTEARYNGTTIVAISPDMNASAIHADLWVPLKPGTDAALAMGMAHVVITEGLYDAELIREQTDLPILVRLDNRKILRQSDLAKGGAPLATYRWDTERDRLHEANTCSLDLDGLVPALEGQFEVRTLDGPTMVTPVFELLKAEVAEFTPKKASELCGVAPETIRKLAMLLVESDAATNTCTSAISKYYHGDLMMRAQILVFLLTGHLGRPGDGFVSASFLVADGVGADYQELMKVRDVRWKMAFKYGYTYWGRRFAGVDQHRADIRLLQDTYVESRMGINSTLFWYRHAGLEEISGRAWDPDLPREVGDYVQEALEKGWQADDPTPDPRVFFVGMGNPLRRVRAAHRLLEVLWPKLDMVVVFDLRMSSTALFADYVLPVSGAYEKATTMALNSNTCMPFLHTTNKEVNAVGESKDEWEIVSLLAKKIEDATWRSDPTMLRLQRGEPCKRLWTDDSGMMEHMWWNIVNTLPGEGTPRGWEQMGGGFVDGQLTLGALPSEEEFGPAWRFNFQEALFEDGAQHTHLRPDGATWGPNWEEDQGGGTFPNSYFFYLPRLCNHCTTPACLAACPVNAIEKTPEGAVLIDEDRCQGNQLCAMACPYKRIYFNRGERVSQKCIQCFPRIEKGVAPACVRQCPGRARHFGDLDDPDGQVYKLVVDWKVALPLHPEFGTEPNVFCVPPILPAPLRPDGTIDEEGQRLPMAVLEGLFSPAVKGALDTLARERRKRAAGDDSPLMDLLISRRWADALGSFDEAPV